jgi:hypothetical protein
LNEHGIYRSDLNPVAAAGISDFRSFNMVLTIRFNEG